MSEFAAGEPLPAEARITLEFERGRVAGSSACNRYSARVEQGDQPNALVVGQPMNFKERCVATLFCLVFSSSTMAGLTAEQWKADLAQMDERVREEHLEPFHSLTEAEWERMLERLGKDIPTLSDTQIMARMAIMVAAIGDGRARLTLPRLQHAAKNSPGTLH